MSVVINIDVMADVVPWKAIVGSPWHMEPLATPLGSPTTCPGNGFQEQPRCCGFGGVV